jgi:hypothetical protein
LYDQENETGQMRMKDVFSTTFGYGPLFFCLGFSFITAATYSAARHFRSLLLYVASLGLLVCTFSTIASAAMPIQFKGNVWPPHWVSWLALVGSPIAVLIAGTAMFAFVLTQLRTRT